MSNRGPPNSASSPLLADARRALGEILAREAVWTEACERAATNLACAMASLGIDRRHVTSELREAGLSRRGARQIVRAAFETQADHAFQETPDGSKWTEDAAACEPGNKPPDMAINDDQPSGPSARESLLCPHCAKPIGPFDHFCPHCAAPVTAHASIDPLGQVYAAGHGYWRATSGRPKFIVLLGMWLIFGPQIPLLLFLSVLTLLGIITPTRTFSMGDSSTITLISYDQVVEILKLVLILGILIVYCAMLWKVTVRYRVSHREADP